MEDLSLLFGVLGNITTVLVILSPVNTLWRIAKNRSVGEFKSFPYVCILLNSSLWAYYGIRKPDELLLVTVNGFGVIVGVVYISIFISFAPPKEKANIASSVLISYAGFIALVALMTTALKMEVMESIGLLCACFGVISYASPLSVVRNVVRTKSVKYMPFLLSFFLFINGIVWTIYAVLLADYFIGVPNGMGAVLGAVQLVLYFAYKECKKPRNICSSDLEDNFIVSVPSSD